MSRALVIAIVLAAPAAADEIDNGPAVRTDSGPVVVRSAPATPVVWTSHRSPVGHTHTCQRCGNVWDHQSNPGHVCDRCGTAQYVQDPVPRMVPVRSAAVPVQGPVYTFQGGGCPSGSCPTSQPFGLRRRW